MCDYASHRPARKCLKRSDVNPESAKVESLFQPPQTSGELWDASPMNRKNPKKEKKHTGAEFLNDVVR